MSSLESPLLASPYDPSLQQPVIESDSVAIEAAGAAKFGEYTSRAKARANNRLRVLGCVPFSAVMLLCIMFLTFGSYWCYDIPGSIETQLTQWFGHGYSHGENLLLYSVYSWPNCVLAFFGGFIIDKITGVRRGALLFCSLIALGQLVFSLGAQFKIYYLALFGRFVFGLGGESLTVAQNTYTVRWFDGKRLALAFGLVVAFSRIGTSMNFLVSPELCSDPKNITINRSEAYHADMYGAGGVQPLYPQALPDPDVALHSDDSILPSLLTLLADSSTGGNGSEPDWYMEYDKEGVPRTVWVGMGMCVVSLIACFLAAYLDKNGETAVEKEREVYMSTLSEEETAYVLKLDELNEPTNDDISFKMITRIPLPAWILFLITATFYVAILNFYQVASDMMQNTGEKISQDLAGKYMAIPNIVAIIGSPLGGYLVDRNGRALIFIITACCMLIGAHVFFLALAYGWIHVTPVPVMLWLGITYSLGASCLWPLLAFVVDKEALGTAYGCMTSVQNVFLALMALVIGQLQNWAKAHRPDTVLEYTLPIWIFIGCASTALVLTVLLLCVDGARGGRMNASAARRAEMKREVEEEQERLSSQEEPQVIAHETPSEQSQEFARSRTSSTSINGATSI